MRGESHNLDLVRSVAVLAVVGRHALAALHIENLGPFPVQFMGIFGVVLFFVHTAHVLMFSLERIQQEGSAGLYPRFLVRRAFRIYPLSGAAVLLGFALTRWGPFPGFSTLNVGDMLANLFLVQNLTGAPDSIGVLWSLPLEVQMYLFLPAIFLVLQGRPLIAVAGMYLAGLALAVAAFAWPLPAVLRFMPCFIPGIVAYALIDRGAKRLLPFWVLPATLALAWVLYEVLGHWSQTVGSYLPCLLVALAIPYVAESPLRILNLACSRIARYSYGIYIVHGVVLEVLLATPMPSAVSIPAFLAITWVLSVLAFRYIEDPLVRLGRKLSGGRRVARVA